MNLPDPNAQTPPVLKPLDSSTKAALLGGTPLAVLTVWIVQDFYMPAGKVIEPTVAVALGTVGASFFGELWMVFKRLLDKIGAPQ